MEEQPSETMVNENVKNGDALAALASVASSAGATINPSASQDAPVDPLIKPQSSGQNQVASQQTQQPYNGQQQQQLQAFWSSQLAEIEQTTEFKSHKLPLARIKKIMKADSDVPRISGEAPPLFAKACEMFIQELTLRAWLHAEEDKRRTLRKNDVTAALARTEVFDFLVDSGPSDKPKGEGVAFPTTTTAGEEEEDDPYRNYYWDDYSPPWSPDDSPGPDLRNDPRSILEYYASL